SKRGFDYLLGVEQFRNERGGAIDVKVCMLREIDNAQVVAWARKNRLDAVVSLEPDFWSAVEALREQTGRAVGFACLSVLKGSSFTGIDQHYEEVGIASMELLRGLMISGARGVIPRPQMLLVEGEWVEGTTAPPIA
ncbi:MAG: hypothetical protein H7067_01085, partial [Burkholderiales bacterium]|nr:hypothetical protein [Opitutaceae bacterium]